jgi:glycosyltransferase involved in cell wall biosynthesis
MSIAKIPEISIIVATFNESPAIVRESLNSISKQTFSNFECIVIDDSSDEECASACKKICEEDTRFTYFHPSERLGLAGSLNLAIDMSRADWVARFDSDDLCMPDRLRLQIDFLKANREVDVLGGAMEIMSDSGVTMALRQYPLTHDEIEKKFQFSNSFAHPTVIFRREIVKQAGSYDVSFRYAEDLELWLRLLNIGCIFANLPDVLVRYRQQSTSRVKANWTFNLRARRKNFSHKLLLKRCLGIAAISIWSAIPMKMQEIIFKAIQFKKV